MCQVGVVVQQEGTEYIGKRNEQAACYAAQAVGPATASLCLAPGSSTVSEVYSGFELELYSDITDGEATLTSPTTALLPAVRYKRREKYRL